MRAIFLYVTFSVALCVGCASRTSDVESHTSSEGVESDDDQGGAPLPSGQILDGLIGIGRSLQSHAPPDYWTGAQETYVFTFHNLLSDWGNYYSFAHDRSSTTEWHNASQIYAYAAMVKYGDNRYVQHMDDTFGFMNAVWDDASPIGGYFAISAPDASWVATDRKYVDDNALTGVAYLEAFEATGNGAYFERAYFIAQFLMSCGLWASDAGGGFQWNNEDTFRPTQSNGLAIQLFLRLYELTGDEQFWNWATTIQSWLDSTLFDGNDFLYSWHTADSSATKFTYDQAIMIDAMLIWYRITGDRGYVAAAQDLAERMHWKLWSPVLGGYVTHSNVEQDGHRMSPTFASWASQALVHLYQVDGNETWLHRARANIDFFNNYLRDPETLGYYLGSDPDGSNLTYAFQAVDQAWMQRAQALLAPYE